MNRLAPVFMIVFLFVFIIASGRAVARPDAIEYVASIDYDQEEGRLSFPSFVYFDRLRDEIYVIDGKSRIIVYTSDLYPLYTLDFLKGVDAPQGLTLDRSGRLYVVQSSSRYDSRVRVSIFSRCFSLEREFEPAGIPDEERFAPHRIAVDEDGNIYLAANRGRGVAVFAPDGKFIEMMRPRENGHASTITNVTIDTLGRIYLVSEDRGRIYVYSKKRKLLSMFGEKGGSSGKLSRPRAVAIDEHNGNRYVLDRMRHTITVYDDSGDYLFEFGGLGYLPGWFQFPNDITIDENGRLMVADFFNHRVQVLKTR